MATTIDTPPAKAWAQVADQALQIPANGAPKMKRIYKIPSSACKDILQHINTSSSLSAVEAWIATAAGALDAGLSGSSFSPPTANDTWKIESYWLDQIEAGEYMKFTCVFGFPTLDINAIATSSDWEIQEELATTVTWQPYSVSPYIYCNEEDHEDQSWDGIDGAISAESYAAKRKHIENAFNSSPQESLNRTDVWTSTGTSYILTTAETLIMAKVAAGVNPVFHKPIVSKSCIYKSKKLAGVPDAPADVDTIDDPHVTVQGWNGDFIFCGRNSTKTSETFYTDEHPEGVTIYTINYTDTWEGALEPDEDFYGENAWKFHEGPTAPNN